MNDFITIKGKIIERGQTNQVSDKFKKRQFVIQEPSDKDPKYDQFFKIEAIQDRCNLIDNLRVGYEVEVKCFLEGRRWDKPNYGMMYFTDLRLYSIDIIKENNEEGVSDPVSMNDATPVSNDDDLPFILTIPMTLGMGLLGLATYIGSVATNFI